MSQEQKKNQEQESKSHKYIKMASKIIVTVLFLLYIVYSFKSFF